jgi:hypothetical protein
MCMCVSVHICMHKHAQNTRHRNEKFRSYRVTTKKSNNKQNNTSYKIVMLGSIPKQNFTGLAAMSH